MITCAIEIVHGPTKVTQSRHTYIYNAMTQNNCFVKGPHKYGVYLFDENKTHANWPNKDRISILIKRNMI